MRTTRLETILNSVSESLGVSVDDMQSKSRRRQFVIARQLFCYIARIDYHFTLKEIGDMIGGRDHTTSIHSIKMISDLVSIKDNGILECINFIRDKATLINTSLINRSALCSGQFCYPTQFNIISCSTTTHH